MNPERWQRIKEVAFAAMGLGEDQRSEFLAKECGSDSELRRAAEALVDEDLRDGSTIERGIASVAAGVQQKPTAGDRDAMLGLNISHYKITEKLGQGGMGVVYKAEDTKLKRIVALKFLPVNELGGEAEKARFLREAQAAAALNHQNICTIYEIDESEGQTFIAMECVEGRTVKDKIASRPQPLEEALDIAIQAAQGLKAAHQKQIVHRDIKPANLMLTEEGQVKVMDFGLAQPADATRLTKTGSTLGTIAYMPPEQIQGQKVDHRADIWSLGVVIYEMVTGQLPFKGEYNQLVAYNIQNEELEPITALRAGVPMELEWIVGKALAKDQAERYQQVEELIVDLRGLNKKLVAGKSTVLPTQTAALPLARSHIVVPKRKLRLQQSLFAVTAVALLVLAVLYFSATPHQTPLRRSSFTVPIAADDNVGVSISPNGKLVAITARGGRGQLWVKDIESGQLRPIEGTEGAYGPFWSPDSDFIGFVDHFELKKVPAQGGPATRVCQLPNPLFVGTWSSGGDSIVVKSHNPAGLYEVPAHGGALKLLISPRDLEIQAEPGAISRAQFLPAEAGGRVMLFAAGSRGAHTIMLQDLDSGRRETLGLGTDPVYSASGHIIYQPTSQTEELWALPFSLNTLKATAEAFPIAENARRPTVADDGTLAYLDVRSPRQLVWLNRLGQKTGEIGEVQDRTAGPALSPDERLVAFSRNQGSSQHVWVWDTARRVPQKVNSDAGTHMCPVWSPDGEKVAYTVSGEPVGFRVLLRQADSSGPETRLVKGGFLTDWSRDGKYLLYEVFPQGGWDLWHLKRKEDGSGWESHPFLTTPSPERAGKFSPNGRYVAYLSSESDSARSADPAPEPYEVYVQSFPGGGEKTERRRVSAGGGRQPRWSRDGKELFFTTGNKLMAAPVSMDPSLSVGTAELVFENPALGLGGWIAQYDVSADGQRFIVAEPVGSAEPRIQIVQNWFAGFRDRE